MADAVSNRYMPDAVRRAASDAVWQALEEGAYIYICDDGRRMASTRPRRTSPSR